MRGYFGLGVEGVSKPGNLGNLVRSAHAFGARFFFTIGAAVSRAALNATDTSHAGRHLPFYEYAGPAELTLPKECRLVGVEFIEAAVALPSFRHPPCAAYVLGPELGSLSPGLLARCDYVVKIPTSFCINVGVAGALVMYDRLLCYGGLPARPVRPGAAAAATTDTDRRRG